MGESKALSLLVFLAVLFCCSLNKEPTFCTGTHKLCSWPWIHSGGEGERVANYFRVSTNAATVMRYITSATCIEKTLYTIRGVFTFNFVAPPLFFNVYFSQLFNRIQKKAFSPSLEREGKRIPGLAVQQWG